MSTAAQVLALPASFTFEGQDYSLPPANFEVHALVADALEQRAWAFALRSKKHLPPVDHANRMDQVLRDGTAGLYEWGSAIFSEWFHTDAGFATCLRFCLLFARQEVSEEKVLQMVKDENTGPEVYRKFVGLNFPNLKVPAPLEPGKSSPSPRSAPSSSATPTA